VRTARKNALEQTGEPLSWPPFAAQSLAHPGRPGLYRSTVAESTPGGSCQVQMRVDLTAGHRGVRWPLGRFTVGDQQLAVHASPAWWIPERSVSKDAVGEISVSRMIVVHLPDLRWRRVEVVRFGPGSAFADVQIRVPRRRRIVDELRGRGYSVTDRGT